MAAGLGSRLKVWVMVRLGSRFSSGLLNVFLIHQRPTGYLEHVLFTVQAKLSRDMNENLCCLLRIKLAIDTLSLQHKSHWSKQITWPSPANVGWRSHSTHYKEELPSHMTITMVGGRMNSW